LNLDLKGRFTAEIGSKTAFSVGPPNFLENDRNLNPEMLFENTEAGWEEKPRSRQC
jgi:hypothetical protein